MKRVLSALLLVACWAGGLKAFGATVTGTNTTAGFNMSGLGPLFRPLDTPLRSDPFTILDMPVQALATNGAFSQKLYGGRYRVEWGGYSKPYNILVPPNDTNTYSINFCAALATNLGAFVWTNPASALISSRVLTGANVTLVTNNPGTVLESVTVSSSGGGGGGGVATMVQTPNAALSNAVVLNPAGVATMYWDDAAEMFRFVFPAGGDGSNWTNVQGGNVAGPLQQVTNGTNDLNTALGQKITDSTNSFKLTSLLDGTNSLNTALVQKITDSTNSFKTTSLADATNTLNAALDTKRADATNSLNAALGQKITDSTNSFKLTSLADATNSLNTALVQKLTDATNAIQIRGIFAGSGLTGTTSGPNVTLSASGGSGATVQQLTDATNSFKSTSLLDATNTLNTALAQKITDATNSFKSTSLLDATNTLNTALAQKITDATNSFKSTSLLDATNSLNTALVTKLTDGTNSFKATSLADATNSLNTALTTKRTDATNSLNAALVQKITDSTNSFKSTSLLDATNSLNTALVQKISDATNSFKTTSLADATNALNNALIWKEQTGSANLSNLFSSGITSPIVQQWAYKSADYVMWGNEPPMIGMAPAHKISLPGAATNYGESWTIFLTAAGTNAITTAAGVAFYTNTVAGRGTSVYCDGTNFWVVKSQ